MDPIWTHFWVGLGPQGPNSGWVPRVQIRAELGRVGRGLLALLILSTYYVRIDSCVQI